MLPAWKLGTMNMDKRHRLVVGGPETPCEGRRTLVMELARPTGLQRIPLRGRTAYNVCFSWENDPHPNQVLASEPLGLLQRLPSELRMAILQYVDDPVDLFCFSTAHDLLLEVGYAVSQRRYLELRSQAENSWIGDRIVTFSDTNFTFEWLPPRLLSEGEIARIQALAFAPQHIVLDPPRYLGRTCREIIGGAKGFPSTNVAFRIRDRLMTARRNDGRRTPANGSARWTPADTSRMEELLAIDTDYEFTYKAVCPWAIFNLSKGEYVRAGDIVFPPAPGNERSTEYHDALAVNKYGIGIGEILMARILWGSQGSYSRSYVEGLAVWAGDRFEIAPMIVHRIPALDESIKGGKWEDVTRDTLKLARKLLPGVEEAHAFAGT
ncbi:hypothetical protein BXZ70DRAFT_1064508 [Cristinia sonorae]|uniref:Uncharacterized protein n=1 Tax=Cristinia sonorae TaxID=1940300 RepID=A0A8K0UQE3_9AGAR|nr:hypothetical protein BXZ70DRAFT_1064508 [Cristinia sonorae]